MPRLAANLSFLFTERPFLERFAAAGRAGFQGVEYLFPYDFDAGELRAALDDAGVAQVLFNLPPGDWDAGERGLAALPGREADFRESVEKALHYAERLDCPRLHMMAGIPPADADPAEVEAVYLRNLRHAAEACGKAGRELLIEPINPRDMPGYFLATPEQARRLLLLAEAPAARLQFDIYHAQIVRGDILESLRRLLPWIGHVQIAAVPHRHEPGSGELNDHAVLAELDRLGFDGWVGCEYRPAAGTEAGLGWAEHYGIVTGDGS